MVNRECLDDGVLHALLLSPLVAAAMLHSAFTQLLANPKHALLPNWKIENPLLLASTPIRLPPSHSTLFLFPSDALKALSALATSRRNLVQLFTLCSFVLLVQLSWSLRLEIRLSKVSATGLHPTQAGTNGGGLPEGLGVTGTYWLRKGEWKRNLSVVGMAFLVTGGCLIVKVATAYIGRGVWSGRYSSQTRRV
jgi:dolichol kinase